MTIRCSTCGHRFTLRPTATATIRNLERGRESIAHRIARLGGVVCGRCVATHDATTAPICAKEGDA